MLAMRFIDPSDGTALEDFSQRRPDHSLSASLGSHVGWHVSVCSEFGSIRNAKGPRSRWQCGNTHCDLWSSVESVCTHGLYDSQKVLATNIGVHTCDPKGVLPVIVDVRRSC